MTGVSKGVLYPATGPGVVWDGLISVTEFESESEIAAGYYDGLKYHQELGATGFTAKIEAVTYPEELDDPGTFGFCYRTEVGDDYEIHLVYNATHNPTDGIYRTLGSDIELLLLTWDISTAPVKIPALKAASHLVISSKETYPWVLTEIESVLYGSENSPAVLPTITELLDIFEDGAILHIIDDGSTGTWTAIGPDGWVYMLDADTFEITSPSAVFIDAGSYKISSW